MITIGPWWLYDMIIMLIAFRIISTSVKNGVWVALYFLLFVAFTYVILTFIPQLFANLLAPVISKLLYSSSFYNTVEKAFSSLSDSTSASLIEVFKKFGQSYGDNVSLGDIGKDVFSALIATILYIIFFVVMLVGLFTLMMIIYRIIRDRLVATKVNIYVSSLIGGLIGSFIAIIFASVLAILFSIPIFDYSSQRFGVPIAENNETKEERVKDYIENGNQYKKYALSSSLAGLFPVGAVSFSYSNSCAAKYVLNPAISVLSAYIDGDFKQKDKTEVINKVFGNLTDTMLEGYATDNILKLPVKQCIQVMPKESQNILRLLTEIILNSSVLGKIHSSDDSNSLVKGADIAMDDRGQAAIMFEQMDKYISTHALGEDFRFNEASFVDFYNESKNYEHGNQFLNSVNYLSQADENGKVQISDAAKRVFTDADKTYKFLKNVYEVNTRSATSSTAPFLPSIYTSLYFMPGLDIVPSGMLSALLGASYHYDDKDTLVPAVDGDFVLGQYMGYVNE